MLSGYSRNVNSLPLHYYYKFAKTGLTKYGKYNIMILSNLEVVILLQEKKAGRPSKNPKPYKLTVRLDEKGLDILDTYCEMNEISRMEGIRRGVHKLKVRK